ncbi:MAG TPA: SPFH domain-containing protein [Streptosporangiaceae bacterium]|nr:SPFH domain-containing protein [Streptosporangiaceae bacterium]HYK66456.1 SPFH domain-containing protein [Streptosporangiaceae bacterium]
MGLLNEARREFIAAPDSAKGQIVYKWPDINIRKFSRAIVEPDATAVFMSQGQVMGVLLPGQHTLDARELPFLGMFVDWASAGNAFRAEIFFVGTREFPNNRFGGRLDEVQDPVSGLIVTLRTFGEYSLRVTDPTKVILNLVGTVDVTDNSAVTAWVTQQLLKVTRTTVTTQLMSGAWPILGLSMHSPEIEAQSLEAANRELSDYGITLTRLGNVDVNLDDEDNARLKKLAGDTAYSRLAGGFLQAAQAEALQGAGQGMAQGGGAVTPMFLGAGLGMAGQMMQAPAQAPYNPPPPGTGFAGGGGGYAQQAAAAPPQASAAPAAPAAQAPAPEAATVACSNCSSPVQVGAKFCGECGTPTQKHCTNCNAMLSSTAKFCGECGTPTAPPPSA